MIRLRIGETPFVVEPCFRSRQLLSSPGSFSTSTRQATSHTTKAASASLNGLEDLSIPDDGPAASEQNIEDRAEEAVSHLHRRLALAPRTEEYLVDLVRAVYKQQMKKCPEQGKHWLIAAVSGVIDP